MHFVSDLSDIFEDELNLPTNSWDSICLCASGLNTCSDYSDSREYTYKAKIRISWIYHGTFKSERSIGVMISIYLFLLL